MDIDYSHKKELKKDKMDNTVEICDDSEDISVSILAFIMKLIVALFASYLSWTSSVNYSMPLRIVFSFFAFTFGGLYILLFLIFRSDIYNFQKFKLDVSKLSG